MTVRLDGPFVGALYLRTRPTLRHLRRVYGFVGLGLGVVAYVGLLAVLRRGGGGGALPPTVLVPGVVALVAATTGLARFPFAGGRAQAQWLLLLPGGERAAVAARIAVAAGGYGVEAAAAGVALVLTGRGGQPLLLLWAAGLGVSSLALRHVWWFTLRRVPRGRLVRWLVAAGAGALAALGAADHHMLPHLRFSGHPTVAGTTAALGIAFVLSVLAVRQACGYAHAAALASPGGFVAGVADGRAEPTDTRRQDHPSWEGGSRLEGDLAFLWLGLAAARRGIRRLGPAVPAILVPGIVLVLVAPRAWWVAPLLLPVTFTALGPPPAARAAARGHLAALATAPARAVLGLVAGRSPFFAVTTVLILVPSLALSSHRGALAPYLLTGPFVAVFVAALDVTTSLRAGRRWLHLSTVVVAVTFAGAVAASTGPLTGALVVATGLLLGALAAWALATALLADLVRRGGRTPEPLRRQPRHRTGEPADQISA